MIMTMEMIRVMVMHGNDNGGDVMLMMIVIVSNQLIKVRTALVYVFPPCSGWQSLSSHCSAAQSCHLWSFAFTSRA